MALPKLVVLVLTLAALLWPTRAESPVQAVVKTAPADVTIEHQLIRVEESRRTLRRPRVAAANRLAAFTKPIQRGGQPALVVRAGRLIMGDGRYRPEPFPRPGQ